MLLIRRRRDGAPRARQAPPFSSLVINSIKDTLGRLIALPFLS